MIERLRIITSRRPTLRLASLTREDGQTTPEWAMVVAFVVALAVFAFGILRDPIISGVMRAVGSAIVNAIG